jgi:hypothetical protein
VPDSSEPIRGVVASTSDEGYNPCSTEDLDLFVEESNIERLKLALKDAIADPEIEQIAAADLLGPYPAVQYFPPGGAFHIDILTRLGDAFHFCDLETERVPYEDVMVTVVTPQCSIA